MRSCREDPGRYLVSYCWGLLSELVMPPYLSFVRYPLTSPSRPKISFVTRFDVL